MSLQWESLNVEINTVKPPKFYKLSLKPHQFYDFTISICYTIIGFTPAPFSNPRLDCGDFSVAEKLFRNLVVGGGGGGLIGNWILSSKVRFLFYGYFC